MSAAPRRDCIVQRLGHHRCRSAKNGGKPRVLPKGGGEEDSAVKPQFSLRPQCSGIATVRREVDLALGTKKAAATFAQRPPCFSKQAQIVRNSSSDRDLKSSRSSSFLSSLTETCADWRRSGLVRPRYHQIKNCEPWQADPVAEHGQLVALVGMLAIQPPALRADAPLWRLCWRNDGWPRQHQS